MDELIDLPNRLKDKTITPETLATRAREDPDLIPSLLAGLRNPAAAVRYGSSKTLILISQQDPTLLYPHFQDFVQLLDSPHRILTWNALTILANLTTVDTENKFEKILDRYYHHLTDGYLVTATTIIDHTPTIITAKPYLADRITTHLLKTDAIPTNPHLTEECKQIIAAKTITTLDTIYPHIKNHDHILKYISRYTKSTRPTTKKLAETFLKKHRATP